MRLELTTSRATIWHSNQLNYIHRVGLILKHARVFVNMPLL